jgi:hypothetical protein
MCCFSGPVQSVAGTRVFARATAGGKQALAYQMTLSAAEDVAMILPLPVPQGVGDGAVRFINLEAYGTFFEDLWKGVHPVTRSAGLMPSNAKAALEVVQVGSFEASFVPTVKDFGRLDPRFRLPAATWDALPEYKSYGFAVFKLRRESHTFHPMAFEFPRSDVSKLFFPTVHVHDGQVHPKAPFDHTLYCQLPAAARAAPAWRESAGLAGQFMDVALSNGLVDPDAHCYLQSLQGSLPNRDTWVSGA